MKNRFIFLLCTIIISSCSSGESADPKEPEKTLPGKAVGILPKNAETCSDFEEIPEDTGKVNIFFSWSTAENATKYLVKVFEANTQVNSTTVTATSTKLPLVRGKSYSWTITSQNTDGETQSDTFSFITPGEPISNFAPYAAEISLVFFTDTNELEISWVGKDEDGDSLTYDVIVKEGDLTLGEYQDLTTSGLGFIPVTAGNTYIVQVKAKDSFGNFSISTKTIKVSE